MSRSEPTFIGEVAAVSGAVVRVRMRDDMPSALILIEGDSYRVGQVGGFFRIPLGHTQLYAVCTQVGADAAPPGSLPISESGRGHVPAGFRWLTVILFGEGVGTVFERGVGQYPTVGDEVHIATRADLRVIYQLHEDAPGRVVIGQLAAATGLPAHLNVARFLSRHAAIVGSTGAGKSNLVTVLLGKLAAGQFPRARIVVIDPHGEYDSALGPGARVFRIRPDVTKGEHCLVVPFWALPFGELQQIALGPLQQNHEAAIREIVLEQKIAAAAQLAVRPPPETLTADSPVPFSIKKLWYDLDRHERVTFKNTTQTTAADESDCSDQGDAESLRSAVFPPANPYNQAPYKNKSKRNIDRALELMKSRLQDARLSFLFSPSQGFEPDLNGTVAADLDVLLAEWVGHDKPISVFDVSGLPQDVLPTVVGTMLRVIYDALFWGQDLPAGGRHQPLLVVVDEAHRFVPDNIDSSAHRILTTIAKEGRKYGVGLLLVTQRPSEIDSGILSQCGTLVGLRMTNTADRAKVTAVVPDDLSGLLEQLPALRTGEGIFVGEGVPILSRVRIDRAKKSAGGSDPELPEAWQNGERPPAESYRSVLKAWRTQTLTSVRNPT